MRQSTWGAWNRLYSDVVMHHQNGPSVVQLSDIRLVFVNENGNIVYMLTIPAEPTVQWNRGCVPGFLPGWISMQMKGHLQPPYNIVHDDIIIIIIKH